MNIADRVAVVTGASSGIGAAVVRELAQRGAQVIGVARRADKLDTVMASCDRAAHKPLAHAGDVSRRADCERVVADAVERFGRVDIVVNNAGISIHRNAAATTADDIEQLFAVNFFGPVYLATAALPGMLGRRAGSIVNVTSVAGYIPNPGESAYGATKAALSRWSHGLAVDLHGTGVHVGTLSPGPIDTEIWSLDEELTYHGKLHPPAIVAKAAARMIEREIVHLTSPRNYGAVGALYPLLGRSMRWGMRRYDDRTLKTQQPQ